RLPHDPHQPRVRSTPRGAARPPRPDLAPRRAYRRAAPGRLLPRVGGGRTLGRPRSLLEARRRAPGPGGGSPMSVAEDIINGMTTAPHVPCQAPEGTATCPLGRVRIGVFFDGTGNSMYTDWPVGERDSPATAGAAGRGPTNVAKLWKLFIDQPPLQKRVYHHG